MEETRLFFVVDSPRLNEEIFDTLEKANHYYDNLVLKGNQSPRLRICMVRHAYYEEDLKGWNYDDLSDTFETVKTLLEYSEKD